MSVHDPVPIERRVEQAAGLATMGLEAAADRPGAPGVLNAVAAPVAMLRGGVEVANNVRRAASSGDTATRVDAAFGAVEGGIHAVQGVQRAQAALSGDVAPGAGGNATPLGVAEHSNQLARGLAGIALHHNESDTRNADGSYTDHAQDETEAVRNAAHGWLRLQVDQAGRDSLRGRAALWADRGLTAGTAAVDRLDAQAERNGTYGLDPYARSERGAQANEAPRRPADNASGSEDAANTGARAFREHSASSYHYLRDRLGLGESTALQASEMYGHLRGGVSTVTTAISHAASGAMNNIQDVVSGPLIVPTRGVQHGSWDAVPAHLRPAHAQAAEPAASGSGSDDDWLSQ